MREREAGGPVHFHRHVHQFLVELQHPVVGPHQANEGASHGLMVEPLSEHLRHHVAGPDDAASRESAVEDIASILKTYLK